MCITIKAGQKPRKALFRIPVYKVMTAGNQGPYHNEASEMVYIPGAVNKSEEEYCHNEASFDCNDYLSDVAILGAGYLFCYRRKKDAERLSDYITFHTMHCGISMPLKIVKMYVPAGTEYYRDTYHRDSEIAARALYWPEDV